MKKIKIYSAKVPNIVQAVALSQIAKSRAIELCKSGDFYQDERPSLRAGAVETFNTHFEIIVPISDQTLDGENWENHNRLMAQLV